MRLPADLFFLVIEYITFGDHRTLYSVARTCRFLTNPALIRLWHTLDSLVPLALLIPMDFYEKDALASGNLKLLPVRWVKLRNARFISRILIYGKYVEVLRDVHSRRFTLHLNTLRFLLYGPRTIFGVEHVTPNLMKFRLRTSNRILQRPTRGLVTVIAAALTCPKLAHFELGCIRDGWHGPETLELGFDDVLQEMTDEGIPLQTIQFFPFKLFSEQSCDFLVTPSTLNLLGLFKSITCLRIGLKTSSHEWNDSGLFDVQDSAFPALRYLRLRLYGSDPVTPLLQAMDAASLEHLYLHLMQNISLPELEVFLLSLERFKDKLSNVNSFALQARVNMSPPAPISLIEAIVTIIAPVFPSLTSLKLKVFPKRFRKWGLAAADDLFYITDSFPALRSLKVAASASSTHLMDVVLLAQCNPLLHTIGINFGCYPNDADWSYYESEPGEFDKLLKAVSPSQPPPSQLRTLKVRYSEVTVSAAITRYLRERLPWLCHVERARGSPFKQWDAVHESLASDRRKSK